jgi:branched-chain amino acid transport system ATP-binding protein
MIRQPGQHVGEPGLRITILLVEQLASYALAIADYGFVVANGRIAREGPSPVLSRDPEVMEAFLGKKKSAISTKA